jgi:predicted NBD/HSP70 family sugar kinase
VTAGQAIDEMLACLAKGIANICYVLNPEVLILGGGIMEQEDYLRPRLLAVLKQNMVPKVFTSTRFAFAEHKNDAGMLGALYHFLQCRELNK